METSAAASPSSMRLPLFGIVGLVVASIVGVAAVRWSGMVIHEPDAPVLMERSLLFSDRADGGIDVVDARSGQLVETVVGEAGFVRGTLRGLARERRRAGIGSTLPFELVSHTDGRLTLVDPSTAHHVDLESFGPTNMGDFLRLLNTESTPRPAAARN